MKQGPVAEANVACTSSIVKYGKTAGNLNETARGTATAYTQLYPMVYGELFSCTGNLSRWLAAHALAEKQQGHLGAASTSCDANTCAAHHLFPHCSGHEALRSFPAMQVPVRLKPPAPA